MAHTDNSFVEIDEQLCKYLGIAGCRMGKWAVAVAVGGGRMVHRRPHD